MYEKYEIHFIVSNNRWNEQIFASDFKTSYKAAQARLAPSGAY
jgi:hypothetical protein